MIADIISNKKLYQVVTELFITRRKLNISIVFITETYLPVNKQEVQQIAINHSSGINS